MRKVRVRVAWVAQLESSRGADSTDPHCQLTSVQLYLLEGQRCAEASVSCTIPTVLTQPTPKSGK